MAYLSNLEIRSPSPSWGPRNRLLVGNERGQYSSRSRKSQKLLGDGRQWRRPNAPRAPHRARSEQCVAAVLVCAGGHGAFQTTTERRPYVAWGVENRQPKLLQQSLRRQLNEIKREQFLFSQNQNNQVKMWLFLSSRYY